MKRMLLFLLVIALCACGDDDTPVESSPAGGSGRRLVYNASNVISSGQALLEASMSGFTSITNEKVRAYVRALADYTIFPVSYDHVRNFNERIKNVLGNADKGNNVNYLINEFVENGQGGFHGMQFGNSPVVVARRAKTNSFLEDLKDDAWGKLKSTIVSYGVNTLLGWSPVKSVLGFFGLSAGEDTFKDEVRQKLDQIEAKVDQIQKNTTQILAEISLLHSTINKIAVTEIKSRYKGALQNYYLAATQSIGLVSVSNYFLVGDFNKDLINFIALAKDHQSYTAATNTNTYIEDAGFCSTNKEYCYQRNVGTGAGPLGISYSIFNKLEGFPNPQKHILMSYADLETVGDMMLTRLKFNALFFSGAILKNNSRLIAQTYIQQLQEFKTAANDVYASYLSVLNSWETLFYTVSGVYPGTSNPYYGWVETAGGALGSYTSYCFSTYFNAGNRKMYTASTEASDIGSVSYIVHDGTLGAKDQIADKIAVWNAIKLKFEDEKNRAMMEYLGPYMARLIAIETLLRSYL